MKVLFAATLALAPLAATACPGLEVKDAWIREAPPGAMMLAAYARLRNTGRQPLSIDGAGSKAFGEVSLHRTTVENGVDHMTPVPTLTLDPGSTQALAPGGYHLMLMQPARTLATGDKVRIRLSCGIKSREFVFTVKAVPE